MKKLLIITVALGCILVANNLALGQTWKPTSAPGEPWFSVASSADGTKLYAGANLSLEDSTVGANLIYLSTNSGLSWSSSNSPGDYFASIACSADGSKIFAGTGGGYFYASTNSGNSWTSHSLGGGPSPNVGTVACSADGSRAFAPAGKPVISAQPIYRTTNSGATFAPTAFAKYWTGAASSADGTQMVASAYRDTIFRSTDSGATWFGTSAPQTNWNSVASSADGVRLAAVCYGGGIYVSTNSGGNWTLTSAPNGKDWRCVACSADGTKLAATAYNDVIYYSFDAGATWRGSDGPISNWEKIACSADGAKWVATAGDYGHNGLIYTLSFSFPLPALTVTSSGGSLNLVWPASLTNYVLQEAAGPSPASWSNVTTMPTLKNGLNQVTLPAPTNQFFRLLPP